MQDLENELRGLVAEIIEKDPSMVTLDAKFFQDLGVDSMMTLEILAAIEKKYKISIPEERLPQMTTLREVLNIAQEYLAKRGQNV